MRLLACLIVAPQRGYDEPAILSYAISSFCPTSANGLQVSHPSHLFKNKPHPSTRAQHLLRGRCEQRLKSLVSLDRKHPVVLPVVLEHRMGAVTHPRAGVERARQGQGR